MTRCLERLSAHLVPVEREETRAERMARLKSMGRCLDNAVIQRNRRGVSPERIAAEFGLEPLTVRRVLEKRDG